MTITASKITFENLVKIEPGLGELLKKARAYPVKKGYCPHGAWYGFDGRKGLKSEFVHLVGWFSRKKDTTLRSNYAYDLAYRMIYDSLPKCPKGCRGCS